MTKNEKVTFSAKEVFKDIRNYLAGRFVGATRDEVLLDELIKVVFCKIYFLDKESINYSDIDIIDLSNKYRKAFKDVKSRFNSIYSVDEEIQLDPNSIYYVHNKLSQIDLLNIERDPIGDAYEIFIGEGIKGQSGQFFTPKNAAKLLVLALELKLNDKVLDLACGAGGFLTALINYYVEFNNLNLNEDTEIYDITGIDKDNYLTKLAKIHLAILTGVEPNIFCQDSLEWNKSILGEENNVYDAIITNPPYGSKIKAGSKETLSKFDLGYKWKKIKSGEYERTDKINESVPPQVVFIEQCIKLVKEKGKIGIVVPESLISTKKYSYVVQYILKHCYVNAVIGMPEDLFKTSGKGGTHTKTCIMILTKKEFEDDKTYEIFLAEAKWCGHDSRGRVIEHDDLPIILEKYLKYKNNKEIDENTAFGYTILSSMIEDNILAPRYYNINLIEANNKLKENYNMIKIKDLIDGGILNFTTGDEVGKLSYGTGNIPFIRTSDISNWEIKADPKHCLSEEVYNLYKDKQDVQAGDIFMVKDGTYLIGTCALITEYDIKMVYQSHLYKIRVNENNKYGIDPYYMLALLSNDYMQQQIKAKTYSQDIINSLGDRYKDLILPIPKDKEKITNISNMVKKSITERIEARELARKAREEVIEL